MNTKNEKFNKLLSDEEIIELYWQRNEEAIGATDTKYGKYLFTIAYNIVRDKLDSEECLNDTYLQTWNSIPPERPNAFQVFISKIMRNAAIDKFREKSASKRIPSELLVSYEELDECISSELTPELFAEMEDIARVLNEFLNSLSDDEALAFICRYYYSDPVERIAKMLKTSKSTIYRDLAQMREKLRKRFEKEGIKI